MYVNYAILVTNKTVPQPKNKSNYLHLEYCSYTFLRCVLKKHQLHSVDFS